MRYQVDFKALALLPEDEKRQVLKELKEVEAIYQSNPLQFFYPYPKQALFLEARDRFKWILGGNRSGKTVTCIVDDIIQAIDWEAVPEHLKPYKKFDPPFKFRIVAMDFDQVELVIFEALQAWLPPGQLLGGSWEKAYNKERRILRFKNGSLCQFKTFEQPAKNHGGAPLHRVHLDEEPPEDIYSENNMRIIDYGGDIICSMTPVEGLTWMYDRFYQPFERGELKNAYVQPVDMDDNPFLSEEAKEAALQDYSAEEREARKTGKFIHFHGRVYPEFDGSHVVSEHAPKRGMPVYIGIDPGIRHMCGVLFLYHTLDDKLVVFEELALRDMNVEEVANEIYKVLAYYKVSYTWAVIDPAAQNREMATGRSLQFEFQDKGIRCFPGQNDPRAGFNRVKVRLENMKLEVTDNCTELISEFRNYRWAKPQKRAQSDPKEDVIKKDDHLLDALRYVCMARPYVPPAAASMIDPLNPAEQAARRDRERIHKPKQPAWMY
jgi:phage terminase large subunit-like protein